MIASLTMNSGYTIPQLGLGTYLIPEGDAERVVADAIGLGYRHIDTAAIYDNEEGVGRGLASSGIPRDEVFVTTKLWNTEQGRTSPEPRWNRASKSWGWTELICTSSTGQAPCGTGMSIRGWLLKSSGMRA
jgi:diketogulonate reductase-like aldo/keto reductase